MTDPANIDDTAGRPFLVQPDDPAGATELARQLRRIRGLVSGARFTDLSAEVKAARELADRIEAAATPFPPAEYESWGIPEHLGSNPANGARNPAAPPLEPVVFPDGTVRADVTLSVAFQGPPGCVHGGIVALLFDEMLGLANAAAEHIGMTADLQITYSAPTPLDVPLRFEARQGEIDGRKIWCAGTLYAGETLCASAEGLFITPRWLVDADQSRPLEG